MFVTETILKLVSATISIVVNDIRSIVHLNFLVDTSPAELTNNAESTLPTSTFKEFTVSGLLMCNVAEGKVEPKPIPLKEEDVINKLPDAIETEPVTPKLPVI